VRGHRTSSLELGVPMGEKLNVLVQFEAGRIPYFVFKKQGGTVAPPFAIPARLSIF